MSRSLFVVSQHDQKYDRQTRIWGGHGQEALETSHVCVLNACAAATETLKNLVLPNVGQFTLVDDKLIDENDVATNFFVSHDQLGRPRAEVARELLVEMNSDVRGVAVVKDPADLIQNDPDFFSKFNLVIAANLKEKSKLKLSQYLYQHNISFISIQTFGLLASLRLAQPQLNIVETHYENDRYDLRIHPEQLQQFPELSQYCDSFADFDTLDNTDHAHVPYIVVLVRLLKIWSQKNGDKYPSTSAEKSNFRDFIRQSARDATQPNFQEAQTFAYRVYSKPEIDADVQAVLDSEHTTNITSHSDHFWLLARAVREFINHEGHGELPVSANIPDMTCRSQDYVRLQQIYRQRAAADRAAVSRHVAVVLHSVGLSVDSISERELQYFVDHIRGIKSIQIRSIQQEYTPQPSQFFNEIFEEYEDPPKDPAAFRPKDIHWYFGLRAADRFYEEYSRYPGDGATSITNDVQTLVEIQNKMFQDYSISVPVEEKCLQEIARYSGAEIHNIAAFIGGVAAQVSLKVLLRQFIPVNNTIIYNGIHERATAYQL